MLALSETAQEFGENGASIRSFLDDSTFVRALIGGRGSGKSRAVIADITEHIWLNAGAKAIVARETECSQSDSTIDSAWQYFATVGELYSAKCPLFKSWNNGRSFRLPSKLAVQTMNKECAKMKRPIDVARWVAVHGDKLCGYLEFRGLPAAEKGKFRGMECSYLALVEADQIAQKQFALSMACLRWKGTDPKTCDEKGFIKDRCVVLDTNPPGKSHWVAQMETEELKKPPEQRTARFWHIDTRENEHNLPPNYIRDTILTPYANNPAMIERMLHGQYADAYDGKPVYFAFRSHIHSGTDLEWPRGATLVRGHDFGTSNATIFSAYWKEGDDEYWHCLLEQYLEGSDSERQARGVQELTAKEFPFALPSWPKKEDCAGVLDFCDPSGDNSNFSTKQTGSSVKIFQTVGIFPGTMLWNRGIAVGITLLNRLMEKKDRLGRPVFMIDRKNCPLLFNALSGGYRYPEVGESGYGKDEPLKGCVSQEMDYSHVCFVAGTMIETPSGSVPIECLNVGDMVMTRSGYRSVTASFSRVADVMSARFSNGTELTATPDHPFWSISRGEFIPLQNLSSEDILWACEKPLYSTESNITDTRNRNQKPQDCISKDSRTRNACCSIGQFGNLPTAQSRTAFTSTTRTKIPSTIQLKIWSALAQRTTLDSATETESFGYSPSLSPHPNHTEQQQGSAPRPVAGEARRQSAECASTAKSHFPYRSPLAAKSLFDSVQRPATTNSDITTNSITSRETAEYAEGNFSRGNITRLRGLPPAVRVVARHSLAERQCVYNITVEQDHEYFANGILVSNCDAWRYSAMNCLTLLRAEYERGKNPLKHVSRNINPLRKF